MIEDTSHSTLTYEQKSEANDVLVQKNTPVEFGVMFSECSRQQRSVRKRMRGSAEILFVLLPTFRREKEKGESRGTRGI
jgi:hypothetical protein